MRLRDFCSLLNVPKQVEVVFEKKKACPPHFTLLLIVPTQQPKKLPEGQKCPFRPPSYFSPQKLYLKKKKCPFQDEWRWTLNGSSHLKKFRQTEKTLLIFFFLSSVITKLYLQKIFLVLTNYNYISFIFFLSLTLF